VSRGKFEAFIARRKETQKALVLDCVIGFGRMPLACCKFAFIAG
jgi:hypothetical protein